MKNAPIKAIEIAGKDPWLQEHPPEIEWHPFAAAPHFQDPSHDFVRTIISSLKEMSDENMEIKPTGGTWTEDSRLAQYFGIPAVSMGPQGGNAHGNDEWVDLESVKHTTKAIAVATWAWCSKDKTP